MCFYLCQNSFTLLWISSSSFLYIKGLYSIAYLTLIPQKMYLQYHVHYGNSFIRVMLFLDLIPTALPNENSNRLQYTYCSSIFYTCIFVAYGISCHVLWGAEQRNKPQKSVFITNHLSTVLNIYFTAIYMTLFPVLFLYNQIGA